MADMNVDDYRMKKPRTIRVSWPDEVVFFFLRLIKERNIINEIDGITQRNKKIYEDLSADMERCGFPGYQA